MQGATGQPHRTSPFAPRTPKIMFNTTITHDILTQIRRIELRTRRLVTDSFAGEYHSVFKGRGMAFEEVRPYQPGDEIRT
ncbi:MAG: hypothetical protein KDD89_12830, partial [Anaerolineales bacterium]|nr:hypothetical protein [Anaerolineales bacterium]